MSVPNSWMIVKVGGSLYDLPILRQKLESWLERQTASHILILAGGGAPADCVREWDLIHDLGEKASHWLAIHCLSLNARFLQQLVPSLHLLADVTACCQPGRYVLDAYPFFLRDDFASLLDPPWQRTYPGAMGSSGWPHQWNVTSDSLAVRLAIVTEAKRLVLLKSVPWDVAQPWTEASEAGVVDPYFPEAMQRVRHELQIEWVNLRLPISVRSLR